MQINRFDAKRCSVESFRIGYPRFSALMQSDKDFVLFRRFGQLHARILLHKQDSIIALEQELNYLDTTDNNAFSLQSRRSDGNSARHEILAKLDGMLKEYGNFSLLDNTVIISNAFPDEMLDIYLKQIERERPNERNLNSVAKWLDGNKPFLEEESKFLDNWDDVIGPVHGATRTGIQAFVEDCAAMMQSRRYSSVREPTEPQKFKAGDSNELIGLHLSSRAALFPPRHLQFH